MSLFTAQWNCLNFPSHSACQVVAAAVAPWICNLLGWPVQTIAFRFRLRVIITRISKLLFPFLGRVEDFDTLYVSYTAIYQAVSTVICWIKLNWLFTSQTWITLDERHPVKQILLCAMVFGIICNYISFLCIFLVENFLCHCFDYFFLIPRLFDRIVEGSEPPNESQRQRIEFSLFIYIYILAHFKRSRRPIVLNLTQVAILKILRGVSPKECVLINSIRSISSDRQEAPPRGAF